MYKAVHETIYHSVDHDYTPNGYIVPMEFRVHFFPRISAFSRRTKMHLNGMLLIRTEFLKIIVPLQQPPISW